MKEQSRRPEQEPVKYYAACVQCEWKSRPSSYRTMAELDKSFHASTTGHTIRVQMIMNRHLDNE